MNRVEAEQEFAKELSRCEINHYDLEKIAHYFFFAGIVACDRCRLAANNKRTPNQRRGG